MMGGCQGFFAALGAPETSGEGPEGPTRVTGVSDMGGFLGLDVESDQVWSDQHHGAHSAKA